MTATSAVDGSSNVGVIADAIELVDHAEAITRMIRPDNMVDVDV